MYRMNNCGSSPRDRLDPRLLERIVTVQDNDACHRNSNAANACPLRQIRESNMPEGDGNFDYALAMVYAPEQSWQNIYCVEEGLKAGTIFKELNKLFYGAKCHGGNCNE